MGCKFWLFVAISLGINFLIARESVEAAATSLGINFLIARESVEAAATKVVPVERLVEGRQKFGSTQTYLTTFPPWVNATLFQIGRQFIAKNIHGCIYSIGLSSLLVGVSTDARRVIISAGNSIDPNKAIDRYLANLLHLAYAVTVDLGKNEQDFFEMLNLVQAIHVKAGFAAHKKQVIYEKPLIKEPLKGLNPHNIDIELWNAFQKDLRSSELKKFMDEPIFPPRNGGTPFYLNQFAMAMQHWAFVAFPENVLSNGASEEELWGYIHIWALVGHAIGIDDQYNICLQSDLSSARLYFKEMLNRYFIPPLLHLDYETKVVIEVAAKAISKVFPILDLGFILKRVCIDILGINCPEVHRAMKAQGRLWDSFISTLGASTILEYEIPKSAFRFLFNGMLQVSTLRQFNLNTLVKKSFEPGLLALDEEFLRNTDIHYYEGNTTQV